MSQSASLSPGACSLHEHIEPIELGTGLHLLPMLFELDGTVASHPLEVRGVAPMNAYLFVEGSDALLLESGFSVHQDAILGELCALLSPGTTLSLWAMRLGEYPSVCNVRPLVEQFGVRVLWSAMDQAEAWVDFRPEYAPYGLPVPSGGLGKLRGRVVSRGESVAVGTAGRRVLALDGPLRLLPVNWAYDAQTRTLFTADAFGHVWQPTASGPWVVTADDDHTTPEEIWHHLVHTRFWWLPGARTERIRSRLGEIFETYEVDCIAPAFGCVIKGRELVARHYAMLDELLAKAPDLPSIGADVGRWMVAPASFEASS